MSSETGAAVLTAKLPKGTYEATVYGIAYGEDTDAVYVTFNDGMQYRVYSHEEGISPFDQSSSGSADLSFNVTAKNSQTKITIETAEIGVKIDRIEIMRVAQ